MREEAARALGEIGSKEAVGALIEALKDEDRWVYDAAAEALTKIPPEKLAPGLREALKSREAWVRKVAVSFVGYYFDEEKLLDELQEIAAKDPYREVRSAALEAKERYHRKLTCLGRLQA